MILPDKFKFAPYSFSRLSVYKHCPRKFKYIYIDKVKSEKTDMTALLKGRAVHSILEHYPERSPNKLSHKYQHIVNKFLRTNLGANYISKENIREFRFGITKDLQITEYGSKDAIFRGSIDYICKVDGTLYLIDWKSGKARDEKWQDYDQLMFYAIYFFLRYKDIKKIVISYVYVEHQEHENAITLERTYLKNYVTQLLTQIISAESDTEFNKNPGRLCDYCDFKEHCSNDTI